MATAGGCDFFAYARCLPVVRAVNPGAPREGVNKLEYYHKKFGKDRVDSMVPAMTKNFADVGVKYSMGGMTGSTTDSHRLATWTKDKYGLEKQNEVMTQMFQAYFSVRLFSSALRVSPSRRPCCSLQLRFVPPCPQIFEPLFGSPGREILG